jgi:hypothetical protein
MQDPSVFDLELAERYGKEALELTGKSQPEVLDTLAEIYIRKGGRVARDQALQLLRQAITLAPKGDDSYEKRMKDLFPNEKL